MPADHDLSGLNQLLPLLDRVLEPINSRLAQFDSKLDRVLVIGEKMSAVEAADVRHNVRLDDVEKCVDHLKETSAILKGRQQVIIGALVLVIVPILVGLAVAGFATSMGWKP